MLLGQQTQANPIGYLDYYVRLIVSNCCGSDTTNRTITVRPSPRVDFDIFQNVILNCNDTTQYLIAANDVELIFNPYIDTVNTDYLIIDWGDGTTPDSIYPYWYTLGTPLNAANVWGNPGQQNALTHQYMITSNSGFTITVIGYNECDQDTAFCTLPVLPNNVISEVYILNNNVCVGDSVWFLDNSTSAFPNTVTRWWWDYDPSVLGSAADTTVNFTPPNDTIYHIYDIIDWHIHAT